MEKRELNTQENILYEIKSVLVQEENQDKECVSLYDVTSLINDMYNQEELLKEEYKTYFRKILKDNGLKSRDITIFSFDYDKKQLRIGYRYILNNYDIITFSKENGELCVVKSDVFPSYQQELMGLIGKELPILYDKFMQYLDFNMQVVRKINAVNSNFPVRIDRYGTSIFVPSDSNIFLNYFTLIFYRWKESKYEDNFDKIKEALKGHEDNLFKKLYVRIEDCPEWSREALYQIRQEQLNKPVISGNPIETVPSQEEEALDLEELETSKEEVGLGLVRKFFNRLKNKNRGMN